MSKKAKSGLAFFLGFLLGLIFPALALVGAAFIVKPETISSQAGDYVGDMSSMSIGNIAIDLYKKFSTASAAYTLGDLIEDYNIDTSKMDENVAAIVGDENLQTLPISALFSDNGIDAFLTTAPVNAFLGLAKSYLGDNYENVKTALDGKTLKQLISFGEENGTATALEGVKIKWLVPDLAQSENALLAAVADCFIGKALTAFSSGQILQAIAENGALAPVGQVTFVNLLGGSGSVDASLTAILGDKKLCAIINGEGELDPLGLLDDVKIGSVLGYTYDTTDNVWKDSSSATVGGIEATLADVVIGDLLGGDFNVNALLGDTFIGELMSYTKATQAQLTELGLTGYCAADCDVEEHTHGDSCYAETDTEHTTPICGKTEHTHNYLWLDSSNKKVEAIVNTLANLQISSLLSGNFSIDGLLGDTFIGELLGYTKVGENWKDSSDKTVSGVMAALANIKLGDLLGGDFNINTALGDVYLGELLSYTKDGENWIDSSSKTVTGVMAALADIKLGDLLGGSFSINDALGDVYIGELMSYTKDGNDWKDSSEKVVTGVMAALADVKLGDLLDGSFDINTALGDVYIGELMSYTKATQAKLDELGVTGYCAADCADATEGHAHKYYWLKSDGGKAETLMMSMANVELGDLLSGNFEISDALGDSYLGEVLGYTKSGADWLDGSEKVTGIMAALAKVQMSDFLSGSIDINNILGDVALGEILNYTKASAAKIAELGKVGYCAADCADATEGHTHKYLWLNAEGNPVDSLNNTLSNIMLGDLLSGSFDFTSLFADVTLGDVITIDENSILYSLKDCSIGNISTEINNVYLGDFLGLERKPVGTDYEKVGEDYVWYEKPTGANPHYETEASGVSKVLANMTVGSMNGSAIMDKVNTLTIADVLGYTYDTVGSVWKKDGVAVTGIMATLADKQIGNLSSVIDTLTLREVLGDEAVSSGILKSLADTKINDLNSAINNVYLGDVLSLYRKVVGDDFEKVGDEYVWYTDAACLTKASGINAAMANITVGGMNGNAVMDKVNTLTIADVLGYTYDTVGSVWKKDGVTVTGIMASLAGTQISGLSAKIDTLTLRDVLGDSADSGILKSLADEPINNISTAINGVYLGDVLSLYRKIDGEDYEKADGEYVWYSDSACATPATGINAALANLTIGGMGGNAIKDKINTLALADVMGEENMTGILANFKTTKIQDLSTAFDAMYMGTISGLYRKAVADVSAYTTVVITDKVLSDGTNYVRKGADGSWFEASAPADAIDGTHTAHVESCYKYVWFSDSACTAASKGINGAVANIALGEFGADTLTDVLKALTVEDFMNDGILSFDAATQLKLSLIFCQHGATLSEYTTGTLNPLSAYYGMTMTEYLDAKHTDDVADLAEDMAYWKGLDITTFINAIISSLG